MIQQGISSNKIDISPAPMRSKFSISQLLLKGILTSLTFLYISAMAPAFGPFFTFLFLDILMSIYLCSLFRSRWRWLFLIHPVFVYLTGFGFDIPFPEIETGYTYVMTFDRFYDPATMTLDWRQAAIAIFMSENTGGNYGFTGIYVGVIPVLFFPKLLFGATAPDITVYYSLSLWTLVCTAVVVSIGIKLRTIRKELLFIMALYLTVSPTAFDINSVLHRYTLLFTGFLLFLIAYIGLTRKNGKTGTSINLLFLTIAVLMVGLSRSVSILSLGLFVFLDFWVRGRVPLFSAIISKMRGYSLPLMVLGLMAAAQIISFYIVPERYTSFDMKMGGKYPGLVNIPVFGLVLRIVYAVLSPFPWINFSQWQLYGYNEIFLGVHMLSTLLASWIIISVFARLKYIVKGPDDIRTCVIFGLALLAALAYSGVGWHVYLAPALPFLATLLIERRNRLSLLYPLGFVCIMELVAQCARVLR